ncbi:MAG: DUF1592 domain-containing protein [Lentisphaeraceae bacterium]|nr:DUF1592 domain-containing protein [Lentisphaeraceae bacterium]
MKVKFLVVCMASFFAVSLPADEKSSHTLFDIKNKTFIEDNCQRCHNAKKKKGKFRVDNLSYKIDSNKTAGIWQKILNSLNAGEMPPEGKKQPEANAKADFLDALASTMVEARKKLSDQNGVITMRRLNRREYKNTLRELLGVEINVNELPADTESGFDTVGANLFMSSNQFEQYLALGEEALEEAFTWELEAGVNHKKRFEAEYLTKKYKKYVEKTLDKQKRSRAWIAKFDEAAGLPENKELYAALKKKHTWKNKVRDKWQELPGAPNPKDFGFKEVHQINSGENPYYLAYHQHYLTLPKAEEGAYISVPTVHPFMLPTGFVEFNTPSKWPPGNYLARVRIGAKQDAPFNRKVIEFGIDAPHGKVMSTHRITGTHEEPQIIEMPFTLTRKHKDRENRQIFIREKASDYHISHKRKFFNEEKKKNGLGPEFVVWIDWVEIERLPNDKRVTPPALKALGISLTDDKGLMRADLLKAFTKFTELAFRNKEVSEEYIEKIYKIYESRRKGGENHRDSLRYSLSIILSSPMFLYISEPLKDQQHKTLSGEEFAMRLSYFIWGAPADAELMSIAKSGKIYDHKVLAKQTERLLGDPRGEDFIHSFTYQWLGLDRLDFFQVDIKKYRTFDDSVKLAAKQEVYESVKHVLSNNLSMKNLLKADYVLANNVLADFYGIEGVKGDHFRKVKLLKNSPRGGLMGMTAVHLMGGNGIETSPVERGAWVLRKLFNTPPPPAPANVPMLSRLSDKVLTTRERQKAHQEDPQCRSCHRKIDPIGFGMENFDAVGLWREEDSYYPHDKKGREIKDKGKTWKIDPAGQLHRGQSFKNFFELRDIVASNTENFTKGFCEALVEYAMGRPTGVSDELLIESMLKDSKGYKMREIILSLVKSKQFRTK